MKRIAVFSSIFLGIISLGYFLHLFYFLLIFPFFMYLQFFLKFNKSELLFCLVVGCLFFVRVSFVDYFNESKLDKVETNFIIEVVDQLQIDGNKLSFLAKEKKKKEKLVVSYYFTSEEEKIKASKNIRIGHLYQVTGTLKEPATISNPHAFDYKNYLYKQKIHWQLQLKQIDFPSFIEQKNILTSLKNTRKEMKEKLSQVVPDEIEGVFIALILGDRFFIDEELSTSFEKLGVVHLLAISGLHVSLLMGMIYVVCIRLNVQKEHATLFLLIILPFYAILTGLAPSVVRACSMLFIFLLMQKLKWKLDGLISLCVVFIGYLLINPYVICMVGFQLSFLITACILFSSMVINRYASNSIQSLIVLTFICQLCSLPLQVYYFYEFSLASLLANFLLIPIFSTIYLPLFAILTFFHLLNFRLSFIYELIVPIISFLDSLTKKLASVDFLTITLGTFPSLVLLMLYACTFCFFILWDQKKNIRASFLVLVFMYSTIGLWNKMGPIGEVSMLDVGQGDSMYIKLPFNQGTYLIDTGGTIFWQQEDWEKKKKTFEVGADVIVPILKAKGITKIDKLILTHFDYDHAGGAFALLEEVEVKEVVIPLYHPTNEIKDKLMEICHRKKIKVTPVKYGDYWIAKKNVFYVFNPKQEGLDSNNSSIVLYALIGNKKWLLMGDAEKEIEHELIQSLKQMTMEVLKVGHHGSQSSTSQELLTHFNFSQAWISVGETNRYGHPSKQVVDLLNEEQLIIKQTNKNGAISYYFFLNKGTFSSIRP